MGEVLTRPPRLGPVDAVGLEERAASLAALDLEGASRLHALKLAVRVLEVHAHERTATPGSVREACARAVHPDPADGSVPSAAAVRVRPAFVPLCGECLEESGVRVVSSATPAEARRTVELGADEVATRLDAAAFLTGGYAGVADRIARVKDAAGAADLTVVVDPEELGTYDDLRRAALLAAVAGADFVELSPTSLPAALCVVEAIRDVRDETGYAVGFKAAGIRTAERAVRHLVLVHETLGPEAPAPGRYRLGGGSGLLDDLVREIRE